MKAVFAVLAPMIIATAKSVLKSLAQSLWEGFWELVIASVGEAEKKFKGGDYAELKKQRVIDEAIKFLQKYRKLSKFQLWAVKLFIGRVIDKMIDDLNENNGKKWVEIVGDLKKYWAGRIPYID